MRVLNENNVIQTTTNKDFANRIKILSPLNSNDILASPIANSSIAKFFKRENNEKIYDYKKNFKKEALNNNFMCKENQKNNENAEIAENEEKRSKHENNEKHEDKNKEKNEEATEYKRLQQKLNVLEKKILSIKSNYDLTLKKNDKQSSEPNKIAIKKNEFVSSSCNFYEIQKEKDVKSAKEASNCKSKFSLEISNGNSMYYIKQHEIPETTKKNKAKPKEENTSLNNYVTQVKPHNIFPNNVYEDILPKNLNISEISIKNENNKENSSMNKKSGNMVKVSVLKLIFKSDIYYISSVLKAFLFGMRTQDTEAWKEHFHQTMQAVLFSKFLKAPNEDLLEAKKINLPRKDFYKSNDFFLIFLSFF